MNVWCGFLFAVVTVLVSVQCEKTLSRDKRFAVAYAGFPFPSYARTGAGFPFSNPMFNPWDYSRGSFFPFNYVPIPMPSFPKNWYEGPNVCKEVKTINEDVPEVLKDFFSGTEFVNMDSSFNHEQETCKGKDGVYICVKRIYDSNGTAKIQATKYQCCHGFVRDPSGDGCIENTEGESMSDKNYYFVPMKSQSQSQRSSSSFSASSSSSSDPNVDKVPPQ